MLGSHLKTVHGKKLCVHLDLEKEEHTLVMDAEPKYQDRGRSGLWTHSDDPSFNCTTNNDKNYNNDNYSNNNDYNNEDNRQYIETENLPVTLPILEELQSLLFAATKNESLFL